MLTKVTTCAVNGLDGAIVDVEVDLSPGLPAFTVVGLPDAAVQESRERVRAAIRNSGCEFPMQRITMNLAPADLRKQGPSYDLPIAVGILASSGQLPAGMDGTALLGELSLEGHLRHTDGVLPMVGTARDRGYVSAVVPCINGPEAALVDGVDVVAARSLRDLVDHLRGVRIIGPIEPPPCPSTAGDANVGVNLAAVRGQEQAKRALEVAASSTGQHWKLPVLVTVGRNGEASSAVGRPVEA